MSGKLLELTVDIVSAYIGNNPIPPSRLQELVQDVSSALAKISSGTEPEAERRNPAIDPKRSVRHDHIVCLEDGQKYRSLKRHLMSHHGMTPDQYRLKWDLKPDYPMTAPAYSERRSGLAKAIGLGRK
ncbi:MAG: MucR family transcriptional regulator [Rhizobiaceae bacterium]